jgi:hypothetical protein
MHGRYKKGIQNFSQKLKGRNHVQAPCIRVRDLAAAMHLGLINGPFVRDTLVLKEDNIKKEFKEIRF